jgi:hypothetical protein
MYKAAGRVRTRILRSSPGNSFVSSAGLFRKSAISGLFIQVFPPTFGRRKKDMENITIATAQFENKSGGLVARFRKLHPFINPHLTRGSEY